MKWDDPQTKESHPGKPLSQHVKEVCDLFSKFTDFYDIEESHKELVKWVARYHDCGKLDPSWYIGNPRNPPHAERSIAYMRESGIIEELKRRLGLSRYLIIYLILKHHSALQDETSSSDGELKLLCQEGIRNLVNQKSFRERVDIADSFGLFKLADVLSASENLKFEFQEPNVSRHDVLKILLSHSGRLDEGRWKEQLALSGLPDTSLLTAYTGWGKTDASLLFFEGKKVRKVFYLFPTITAINKFYDKLRRILGDKVEKHFYLYEYELASKYGESMDEAREFIVSSFQASHFLKPIIITTVDQFLLSFLQLGKYYLKRVMFRDAGLVVDEVHLLNPKMLFLTLHFIKTYLGLYRFRILLMSATFSEALMRIIQEQIPTMGKLDLSAKYRDLCRIRYSLETDRTVFDMIALIADLINDGKKVLVVFNTVEASVTFAKGLSQVVDEDKILLLHGRFMYRDRERKEKRIDELKNIPHALIATQVCEVSLDISYDVLFTELAPIPSLVQRFGRVNRYSERTEGINVHICKEYRRGDQRRYPYEDEEIKEAKSSLEELDLRNEYELIKKYNDVLSYELLSKRLEEAARELDFKALWERDDRTAYFFSFRLDEEKAKRRLLQLRDEITISVIPTPDCIADERQEDQELRRELEGLLKKWELREISYDQRQKLYGKLKGYLVPVPIWWALNVGREFTTLGLPLVRFSDKIYTSGYGFIKTEEWANVIV